MHNTIKWPGSYRAAAMISITMDSEFIWKSICDLADYNYNTPKNLCMGTYGTLRGLGRLLDSLNRYHVKATFFIPGLYAETYPEAVKTIMENGHEIAAHGHTHKRFDVLNREEQQEEIRQCTESIMNVTGIKPSGFRLPEGDCREYTMKLLSDAGYLYDSSMSDADIAYSMDDINLVEIPIRWEMMDFPYMAHGPKFPMGGTRIAIYDEVLANWLYELDATYDEGGCYVIQFDPQIIGKPGRMFMFDSILQRLTQHEMWIATGKELATYIMEQKEDGA